MKNAGSLLQLFKFRPSCIGCIFRIIYLFFYILNFRFLHLFLLFCCFVVASSVGLCLSGNREINMMMMMMMMMIIIIIIIIIVIIAAANWKPGNRRKSRIRT